MVHEPAWDTRPAFVDHPIGRIACARDERPDEQRRHGGSRHPIDPDALSARVQRRIVEAGRLGTAVLVGLEAGRLVVLVRVRCVVGESDAVIERQPSSDLPGVLQEPVECNGATIGLDARIAFLIGAIHAEKRIRVGVTAIQRVVDVAREVVLSPIGSPIAAEIPRAFQVDSGFEGVSAPDLRYVVSQIEDGVGALCGKAAIPGRARRVRDAAEGHPWDQVERIQLRIELRQGDS
jgi:hypothetical protein